MFGGNDKDEENNDSDDGEERPLGDETWNAMVESVEESARRVIERERERFRFEVFRNEEQEVTGWALLSDMTVEGTETRVPIAVGFTEKGGNSLWFEYLSRHHQERGETTFEFAEKEKIVPSNTFYKWISQAVECVARFNQESENIEDSVAFEELSPNLPSLHEELPVYEAQALDFFKEIIHRHGSYTDEQAQLFIEAMNRYSIDAEYREEFMANSLGYEIEDNNDN